MFARFLMLILALFAQVSARADEPDAQTTSRRLADAVELARKHWRVPGVAVAVVRPDRVVLVDGFGVRRQSDKRGEAEKISADTLFPIGSCTKGFTAAVAARLVDAGKLDWDDPVRKHLPDFRLGDANASALVSLRDLFAHRTGVASHDLLWYRAPWDADEQIRRVGLLPLDKPFRSSFQYQTVMYLAAGRAVEKAGQAPWERQLRVGLLEPLGMRNTHFTTKSARSGDDFAWPHAIDPEGKANAIANYDQDEANPAGSLHSSARDLARWLQLHLNDGRVGDKQIVGEASLRETRTPQIALRLEGSAKWDHPETRLLSYGMGWLVQDYRGHLQASHAGLIDGYRCHLTLLPDDGYGIAILGNLDRSRMNLALSNRLVDLLLELEERNWNAHYQQIAEREATRRRATAEARQEARRPDEKPTAELSAFAGKYRHPAYGDLRIRLDGERLVWEWSRFAVRLTHHAGDAFEGGEAFLDGPMVRFAVRDGAVTACEAVGVRFERVK